jgi:adenylylsulfate kinase
MVNGTVYWVTGLSGAGKTTVGTLLFDKLRKEKANVIRLDGDILREVFQTYDYSYEGRKALGFEYARLCRMIASQGIDVVICTIAMYDDVRSWNRENIPLYREIYLEVSMEELMRRDQKGIYSRAQKKEESNVSGVNMETELPKNPDMIVRNYGDITPEDALKQICERFDLRL